MKILITGGAGFVGSNLAEALAADQANEVVVVDNLSTGHQENLPTQDNLQFVRADVNDLAEITPVFKNGFDVVYHYAAVVGVERTLKNPVKVLSDIDGIKNILELSKESGVKRVLYSSSSEVYGEPVEMPQHEETTPLNSRLPYAVVKNIGESFLKAYEQEYGLDFTIFRFFNTYGSRQSTDFVMSRFLDAALTGHDITVYGDGSQSRTFCYVDDNTQATINALSNPIAKNEVLNIGNDTETRIVDLARKIIELSGSKSKIVNLPPLKEGDMTRRQPDITKMTKLLGRPLISLDEGIKKLIAYRTKST